MKRIGLMDCNNFFVSCERLFRPDLARKPVAVLSSNDGCVVARSQEVKDLGIPMGIAYFKVRDMCTQEGITLFSSNFPLYRDISDRVMHALSCEVENCEVYSVDEAFFEVSTSVTEKDMSAMRARIMQKTGIPVSFGIAQTKTIAKAASTYAKKGNGIASMDARVWQEKVGEISCGSIWGIGRQTTDKLARAGILTVKDYIAQDIAYYRDHFGVVGERMYLELTGTSVYDVGEDSDSISQSITSTRSFKKAVHEKSVLESALGYHVAHIGEKLRERDVAASRIRIIVAPSRFGDYALRRNSLETVLDTPTSDTGVLLKKSLMLLGELYDGEVPYKKAGVVVSGIMPRSLVSVSLFESENTDSRATLFKVIDTLNSKFGSNTVRPGVLMKTEKWRESALLRSEEYTTQWSEIATVKAM